MSGRREFLRRLVQGAAYAAPVVLSFRGPVTAQDVPGMSSQMNPNDGGHGDPMMAAAIESPGPWDQPPPGQTDPPGPIP